MLKQRIIAKLLIDRCGIAVKRKRFTESERIVGDPVSLCHTMADQVLDEFHFCFLGAALPRLVRDMNRACMTASSVAGSIATKHQVDELIRECGVDKIVTKSNEVGEYVSDKYGRQAAVCAVDYGGDAVFFDVPPWAGELLLTSVDRDGNMRGMDTGAMRFDWQIPVVLSGGCGRLQHVADAFTAGASGVAIGSMFAFTDKSPVKLRSWLQTTGANVRVA